MWYHEEITTAGAFPSGFQTGTRNLPSNTTFRKDRYLYSDVQREDDIVVILPAEVGEKHFDFEERVKLVNPRITAEGYKIGTRGFTNYILHADDMVKA